MMYMKKIQKVDELLHVLPFSLETLLGIPENSVYCFLNVDARHVQVYASVCIVKHLAGLLEAIKTSGEYKVLKEEIHSTKIVVLETGVDREQLKLRQAFWIDQYKHKGYSLYKEVTPIRYNLETDVTWVGGRIEYHLYARNKRKGVLLGKFRKKKDMDTFLKENYKDGKVYTFLYHSSVLPATT